MTVQLSEAQEETIEKLVRTWPGVPIDECIRAIKLLIEDGADPQLLLQLLSLVSKSSNTAAYLHIKGRLESLNGAVKDFN